ncbi:MAG: hypothetical protein A3B37_03320 [Candidatus Sungbacteria bacterium RIFCSPLOWO2_01_FULL_59_16]|uniref:Uncharacterized protein n=1 Tax=Candidatus Sungbacteria bacterium RIFCSPLOWO2_01_FULL_59_16 TaxID=1802280 RepID=A0A1G2L9B3_9BACT|nr:MAG: hypothetical protein A3B37_03320 [Candidatus Sungbacteria bacterium RIFCSPLOWO2_01_FULL_59_16]
MEARRGNISGTPLADAIGALLDLPKSIHCVRQPFQASIAELNIHLPRIVDVNYVRLICRGYALVPDSFPCCAEPSL